MRAYQVQKQKKGNEIHYIHAHGPQNFFSNNFGVGQDLEKREKGTCHGY